MTSSFQSTAFQSSAKPVDTFVAPPSVLPKTGIEEIASVLATVNPTLQKFINLKLEQNEKKVDVKLKNLAYEQVFENGEFAKTINQIRVKEGDDVARQLIGGSFIRQRTFDKYKTLFEAKKLGTVFNSQKFTAFDTDEIDLNGQPVKRFLYEYPSNSETVMNWKNSRVNQAISKLTNVSPDIIEEHFIPELQKQILDFDVEHNKEYAEFQFDDLLSQVPDNISSAATLILTNKNEEAKELLNGLFNDFYKTGVTRTDAKQMFKDSLDNIFAIGQQLPVTSKKAQTLVQTLAENIPYGAGGKNNLTDHPDYQEKLSEFIVEREDNIGKKLKNDKVIKNLLNEKQIDEEMITIANLKTSQEKQNAYAKLLKTPEYANNLKYIQERGKLDNYELRQEATRLRNNWLSPQYDPSIGQSLNQVNSLRNSHGTLDAEAEDILEDLETFARNVKGLGENIQSDVNAVMKYADTQIGSAGSWVQKITGVKVDNTQSTLIRRKLDQAFRDYYEEVMTVTVSEDYTGFAPTERQRDKKRQQFIDQILSSLEVEGYENDLIEKKYPIEQHGSNPFAKPKVLKSKVSTGNEPTNSEVSDFMAAEKGAASEISDEEARRIIEAEDAADEQPTIQVRKGDTLYALSQLYDTSVEKIKEVNGLISDTIDIGQELIMPTINKLVNTVGDTVIPEDQTKPVKKSVLDEIDVTKTFSYDSLYRLALEVGFPPQDARIMAAIALAESKGDAQIDTVASGTDPNKENEFSLGLWQINVIKEYQAERFPLFNIKSPQELYDPLTNAKAAFILYDRRKENEKFNDWSTYTDGTYKDFLPKTD